MDVMVQEAVTCPHCGQAMERWQPPAASSWGDAAQWVCFNDACPYYREGWDWMRTTYKINASYRHRFDPQTKQAGPLPVWSPDAHRDAIVKEA